jgi:hypothetical protein
MSGREKPFECGLHSTQSFGVAEEAALVVKPENDAVELERELLDVEVTAEVPLFDGRSSGL